MMKNGTRFYRKEWLLAATLLFGFVLAEVPANIKDYTQTDARYALENYGAGLASDVTLPPTAEPRVPCENC